MVTAHLSAVGAADSERGLRGAARTHHTAFIMRLLRIDAIVTVLASLAACAPLPTEGDPAATTGAVAGPSPGLCFVDPRERPPGPFVCHGPGGTYIAGLPVGHDWKPGTRVYLGTADEITGAQELGVGWVGQLHEQGVELHTLYQAPHSRLVGASARPAGEVNLRGGKLLARASKRQDALITLDIGGEDGVELGDIYEARDPARRDVPRGRAVVRAVAARQASARIIDGSGPIGEDVWVLAGSEANPRPRAVRILVVPIQGAAPQVMLTRVREALAAAKKLPGTLPIHIIESRPITVKAAEKLHAALVQRARDHGADQIVWMPTDCPGGGCRAALHAIVPGAPDAPLEPDPLLLPANPGPHVFDDARAVLGQVAFAAGVADEASYHLRAWAGARAPAPPEVLTRLARAELALGQRERARRWLAGATTNRSPRAYLALADVACQDGDPAELAALAGSLAKRSRTSAELRAPHLVALLCSVAAEVQGGGDPRVIERRIRGGLALAGELGDRPAQMNLKRHMGQLLAAQGQFARADQLFAAALKIAAAASDRPMQARIGLDRAVVRERSGNSMQAERHAHAAFKLFKALGDEQGLIESIKLLARLERNLHGLQAARAFLDGERGGLRRQHLDRAMFALGQESVALAIERGALNTVLPELTGLSATARKHRHSAEAAGLAGLFAEYYYLSGQTRAARDRLDEYARGAGADRPGPVQARAQLLYARFRLQEGDPGAARQMAEGARRSYEDMHDDAGVAAADLTRAEIEREFGDERAAESYYEAARRVFTKVHDMDGVYRVALGKAALVLWRGETASALRLLPPIIRHFQGSGNAMQALAATLLLQWAEFERTGDRTRALQALRASKQRAMKQRYARLAAEAQMLIACVYRRASDHVVAEQELAAGQKMYAALGRHEQPWRCEVGAAEEASEAKASATPARPAGPAAKHRPAGVAGAGGPTRAAAAAVAAVRAVGEVSARAQPGPRSRRR